MKISPVPRGTHRGLVKRRQVLKQAGSPVLELVFELRSGVRLTGRFRHSRFVQKARRLRHDQAVEIDVDVRWNRAGRPYPRIFDFRPVEEAKAITVVGGVMPGAAADIRNMEHDFEPIALCTEEHLGELEELRSLHEAEQRDIAPLPLMPSSTLRDLDTLVVGGSDLPEHLHPSGHNEIYLRHTARFASEHRWLLRSVTNDQRVLVSPTLCDETFARYCRADAEVASEQLDGVSAYEFTDDLLNFRKANAGQLSGYSGMAWSRRFAVVFEAGPTPQDCLNHGRCLVQVLLRLGVPPDQILCLTDGHFGLQVLFPSGIAGAVPRVNFAKATGHFAQVLVDRATRLHGWETLTNRERWRREDPDWHTPISTAVYRPCGFLQPPNTRRGTSETYNVRVTLDELWNLSLPELAGLAKEPRAFEAPSWQASPQDVLVEVWRFAVAAADLTSPVTCRYAHGDKWVFRDSIEFIRFGAPQATCRDRLFRAAANLLDLGCSRLLLDALLFPAAFTSGLLPEEIDRQLEAAIRFVQRPRQLHVGTGWSGVMAPTIAPATNGGAE